MKIEGQNWFPYLPSGWLNRLVELVRRSVPARIDIDWCMEGDRFGLSRTNASQLVSHIRTLDWTNEDGALTDIGRNLRLHGEPYERFMRQELARIYDELVEQLEDPGLDRDALETYFTSASNLGLSGRRQVIATFRWFLVQAGLPEVAERLGGPLTTATPRQTSRARPSQQTRSRRQGAPSPGQAPSAGRQIQLPPGLSGITLSISLQLPAVDDERVYEAIFKAMREHLFGQQSTTE